MRVFLCTPVTQPHLTGGSPNIDELMEMARALLLDGQPVHLQIGEMAAGEFAAAHAYPRDILPDAVIVEAAVATGAE